MKKLLSLTIAACLSLGQALGAPAVDTQHHKAPKKKMRMNEPMTTPMMKKGMMKGDVKKEADRKAREMEPMMEQEEKSMPPEKPNP